MHLLFLTPHLYTLKVQISSRYIYIEVGIGNLYLTTFRYFVLRYCAYDIWCHQNSYLDIPGPNSLRCVHSQAVNSECGKETSGNFLFHVLWKTQAVIIWSLVGMMHTNFLIPQGSKIAPFHQCQLKIIRTVPASVRCLHHLNKTFTILVTGSKNCYIDQTKQLTKRLSKQQTLG